jgi:hypothetical protein
LNHISSMATRFSWIPASPSRRESPSHLATTVSLTSTRVVSEEEELLRMAVPAPFNKAWLDTNLAGKAMASLHKIDDDTFGVGHVAYVVEATA